jgi:serine/threonine protein kinase
VIEAVAGRGGMGVVYRARETRPPRRVALKVIAPDLAADATFRQRFEREADLAATIEHSNVLPVYRVGEEAGLLYLITRYVEGTDLAALLAAVGRLEPRRAVEIVAQVSSTVT